MKLTCDVLRPTVARLLAAALAVATALLSLSVLAGPIGELEQVMGPVKLADSAGRERPATQGGLIEEGDRIVTGEGAVAQVKLADGGFLAIRADTELVFRRFAFNERNPRESTFWVSLLKGGFRSITGLIGKLNPLGYRIETETATIGVRGTDHEPFVIPASARNASGAPGTYDKLNSGLSYIETPQGVLELKPGQVGFAPRPDLAPKLLPKVPDFYRMQPAVPQRYLEPEKRGKREGSVVPDGTSGTESATGDRAGSTTASDPATKTGSSPAEAVDLPATIGSKAAAGPEVPESAALASQPGPNQASISNDSLPPPLPVPAAVAAIQPAVQQSAAEPATVRPGENAVFSPGQAAPAPATEKNNTSAAPLSASGQSLAVTGGKADAVAPGLQSTGAVPQAGQPAAAAKNAPGQSVAPGQSSGSAGAAPLALTPTTSTLAASTSITQPTRAAGGSPAGLPASGNSVPATTGNPAPRQDNGGGAAAGAGQAAAAERALPSSGADGNTSTSAAPGMSAAGTGQGNASPLPAAVAGVGQAGEALAAGSPANASMDRASPAAAAAVAVTATPPSTPGVASSPGQAVAAPGTTVATTSNALPPTGGGAPAQGAAASAAKAADPILPAPALLAAGGSGTPKAETGAVPNGPMAGPATGSKPVAMASAGPLPPVTTAPSAPAPIPANAASPGAAVATGAATGRAKPPSPAPPAQPISVPGPVSPPGPGPAGPANRKH